MSEMTSDAQVSDFLAYMNAAATPYHCVAECRLRLQAAGFVELDEKRSWSLQASGKYFYTRNGSALVAFAVGGAYHAETSGAVIVGAHTDSPCPRLKPRSTLEKAQQVMLGVVGYGGGLWHTWFDRDLTVGGRALVRGDDGALESKLVLVGRPICRVPNLAIHLLSPEERQSGFKPNLQSHLPPVLATSLRKQLWEDRSKSAVSDQHHYAVVSAVAGELGVLPERVVDWELQLCDTQAATRGGLYDEFVFSGRLDNQASCYLGLTALINASYSIAESSAVACLALFDHEEVGSMSATGAQGPLLRDALLRIPSALGSQVPDVGAASFRARSLLVSADMAHAQHPNYANRHDPEHAPQLGKGLVIKHNANQRYATDCVGANFIRACVEKAKVAPCQEFAVKADCGCGTTIGPISASLLGIRTVDVGAPQLSMHSIREQMHVDDLAHSLAILTAAFTYYHELVNHELKHIL